MISMITWAKSLFEILSVVSHAFLFPLARDDECVKDPLQDKL